MTINIANILAALIGAGLTILGIWSAAVADRIRGRRDTSARERSPRRNGAAPAPARAKDDAESQPARPGKLRPRAHSQRIGIPKIKRSNVDEIREWLVQVGYAESVADVAARRAVITAPDVQLDAQIAEAMKHLPVEN